MTTPPSLLGCGVVDVLTVVASEGDGSGFSFGAPIRARRSFPARLAGTMSRVARHIAAARRLRRVVQATSGSHPTLDAEAVLAPEGRVLHAEGEATSKDERANLTAAARLLEQNRKRFGGDDADRTLRLWSALVAGRWSLVRSLDSDGKRLLLARRNTPSLNEPTALTPDERHVLSLFARGHSTALVAYELGLSPPTVSERLKHALAKLGLRSRAELVRLYGAGT